MIRRAVVLVACVAVAACSGAADTPLLGSQDGSTTQPDATTPVDASPEPEAAPPSDAGEPSDAGVVDAAPKDAAPPYQDPGVACGTTDCDPSADLCCRTVTSYYPQMTYAYACESLGDLVKCAAGLAIYCDDDEDCDGGQICCGSLGYSGFAGVQCQATCTGYNIYGQQQIHFCDPKAPDCDVNQQCVPSTQLSGYSVCQ